jgi:epoxyqueuosine reductase QueG
MLEPKMDDLKAELVKFSKEKGADLLGFASVNRFENAPERYRPEYYLSDAKTVISIGIRMNRAVVEALRLKKSVFSYQEFANSLSYQTIEEIAYGICRFLEDQGFDAYPFPANSPKDVYQGMGDFSHKHAAVAAGLGEIGWSYLFLSPQYGPRQVLTTIITNAEIGPDPLYDGKLCNPTECGFKCVRVCPVGAISKDENYTYEIENQKFEHGEFSRWKCQFGCSSMYSIMPMPDTPQTMRDMVLGSFREKMEKSNQRGSLNEITIKNLHYTKINERELSWCYVGCLSHCPVGQKPRKKNP